MDSTNVRFFFPATGFAELVPAVHLRSSSPTGARDRPGISRAIDEMRGALDELHEGRREPTV